MIYTIPYLSYKLKSSQKKEFLLENFCDSVAVVQKLSFAKTSSCKNYEGVLYKSGFNLRRIFKQGYSAFLPILSCEIHSEKNSTHLEINIRFHKYVNIALIVYLLFQIAIFTLNFTSIMAIIIPYIVILFLFNMEIKLLKEKFNKIVKA